MIVIDDVSKCCGCEACVQRCPRGCIEMKADHEGFFYPSVDTLQCIGCGACNRVCPIQNGQSEISNIVPKAYALHKIVK